MRSGDLRHYISFSTPPTTRNALGEFVESESSGHDGGACMAAIRPTSARETMLAGNTLAQGVTHVITMRYTDRIKPTSRITFRSRTFEVTGIINVDERNIELQVLAKEIS